MAHGEGREGGRGRGQGKTINHAGEEGGGGEGREARWQPAKGGEAIGEGESLSRRKEEEAVDDDDDDDTRGKRMERKKLQVRFFDLEGTIALLFCLPDFPANFFPILNVFITGKLGIY